MSALFVIHVYFESFRQTTSNTELCYVKGISRFYQLNLFIVALNRSTIRYNKSMSFNGLYKNLKMVRLAYMIKD